MGDQQTEVSSQPERNSVERDNRKISPKTQSKEDSSDGDGTKENYVHFRAKRGQATNSHSLAERVSFWLALSSHFSLIYALPVLMLEVGWNSLQLRRKKISEKMKLLQDLVPGCNKVTFFFLAQELLCDQLVLYALPMFLLTDNWQGSHAWWDNQLRAVITTTSRGNIMLLIY